MEPTRFDALTRSLVTPHSRRGLSRLLGALALTSPLAALRSVESAAKPRTARTKRGGASVTCEGSQTETTITTTLTVKKKQLSLVSVSETPVDPPHLPTMTMTVRRKQVLVLEQTITHPSAEETVVHLTYGSIATGIDESLFRIADGMVEGEVDARAIVPFPVDAAPEELQFQDGLPAPELKVNKALSKQLKQILARTAASHPDCSPSGAQGAQGARAERRVQAEADPVACHACGLGCGGVFILCTGGVAQGCTPLLAVPFAGGGLYAVCYAKGEESCWKTAESCQKACLVSSACCDAPCGSFCCGGGRTCLAPDVDCCPVGTTPCHGQNCCTSLQTCLANGSCCGGRVCGSTCCGTFDSCCNGACCAGVCINNSTCCRSAQGYQCGSTCCPNDRRCCNGVCCPSGQVCNAQNQCSTACAFMCNGQCCQADEVCCGGSFCTTRQNCPG